MPAHAVPWPHDVALGVVLDHRLAVLGERDDLRAGDAADERVIALDAAVEDADAHAFARRRRPTPTRA